MSLAPEHAAWLAAHAVNLDLAEGLGVRSAASTSDLPPELKDNKMFVRNLPGILLPWTAPDGRLNWQLHPDTPPLDDAGEPKKYLFQKGVPPTLWAVRHIPTAMKIMIDEGSKQCMAAAHYAPSDYAVYGIAGCWAWRTGEDQTPIDDLKVVDGKEVWVILDADASTNRKVYDAGIAFQEALEVQGGATKVHWVRLTAGKKAGLDDLLARVKDEPRRGPALARLIGKAKPKVADKAPPRGTSIQGTTDRPILDIGQDPLVVVNRLARHLRRWDGTKLFCLGGQLSELCEDEARMRPLTKDTFNLWVMKSCMPARNVGGIWQSQMPNSDLLGAVRVGMAAEFTLLDRLVTAPFVRDDGTICTEAGYDKETHTYLLLGSLGKVTVPDEPTPEQVVDARDLILHEWLGDMPFRDHISRANTLAMVLTPFIRGLIYLAPLAVIDGLQMGVGKGLLANCLSLLTTGDLPDPKPFTADDEENRKALMGSFRAGTSLMIFDEAHTIQGTNLARALTAAMYSDRVLGKSENEVFPNKVTWVALGNNVQVLGDLSRRVYWIGLHPQGANPQDRPLSSFHHADLQGWTKLSRAELITACLTLIRAWYVADKPLVPATFGSFEQWQGMVGGILQHAGVEGFLADLQERRSESDYQREHWVAHLHWLRDTFGIIPFTVSEVLDKSSDKDYEAPPGLEEVKGASYGRLLGQCYGKHKEWSGGLRLQKAGTAQGKKTRWVIESHDGDPDLRVTPSDLPPPPPPVPPTSPAEGQEVQGDPLQPSHGGYVSTTRVTPLYKAEEDAPVPLVPPKIVFDLETGSAAKLYSAGDEYIRLAGWQDVDSDEDPEIGTDWLALVDRLNEASLVIGHNIMGFDLPALAKRHGLNMHTLAADGRLFDTLLAARYLDPPEAKQTGRDWSRRYDLGSLATGVDPKVKKSPSLSELVKVYKDYGEIPRDLEIDPDDPKGEQRAEDAAKYREYLQQDVRLTKLVYHDLAEKVAKSPTASAYLEREHRVAAVAAQISINGFRVDRALMTERLDNNEKIRIKSLKELRDRFHIPLTGKGKEGGEMVKSPLATRAAKDALIKEFLDRGVTSYWVTGKTSDIATSREAMENLAAQHEARTDKKGQELLRICKLVINVVSLRTVYMTVQRNLVGEDRVHCTVSMKQSTGRWSLSKPGLTVMGKRGDRWKEREMFVADPGDVIIAVDLSQVDMRAVAGLSGDQDYIDMLSHEDPHTEIAKLLFGTADKREEAKKIGHGWNYGRGIKGICNTYDMDPQLVITFDKAMRARFPRLVRWQDEVRGRAETGALLDNGFGRLMRPETTRAHTQGPALMGQGAARDIMMEGLLRLADRYPEYLPYLRAQVHDEVILSVPAERAREIQDNVIDRLSFNWVAPSGKIVPIVAEGGPVDRTSWGRVYAK